MTFTWLTRKRLLTILAAVFAIGLVVGITACTGTPSANQKETAQQAQDQATLDNNQPPPHYNYSQIRQTLIDSENAAAQTTQTTSFMFQMGDPNPVSSCPSVGYPVAANAELTNPVQVANPSDRSSTAIGEEDPDGVYTSPSTSGTYVICVNSSGQNYLFYWEGDVMAVGGPATWDNTTHQVQITGAPTATVHVGAAGK